MDNQSLLDPNSLYTSPESNNKTVLFCSPQGMTPFFSAMLPVGAKRKSRQRGPVKFEEYLHGVGRETICACPVEFRSTDSVPEIPQGKSVLAP